VLKLAPPKFFLKLRLVHTGFIRAATGNIQNLERSGTYDLVSGYPVRARSPLDSPAGTTEPKGRWAGGGRPWSTNERVVNGGLLAARGLELAPASRLG